LDDVDEMEEAKRRIGKKVTSIAAEEKLPLRELVKRPGLLGEE